MIFINTRPASRASVLSEALRNKGMTVLEMPLLELAPVDISERESHYQQDFYQKTDKYQALVVVSPTAARMGLAACPAGFVPTCAVIAVGHATAKVLREQGWQVQCPDEYSNEGMIKMSALNSLGKGDHILVWRGRGGRRVLVNFLQDNGVEVHAIAWYQRQCPHDADTQFGQLQQDLAALALTERPIALVSSGEAFTNWRLLLAAFEAEIKNNGKQTWHRLVDFDYITFGKRLTETLTELNLRCNRVEHLDTDEVWRGIEQIIKD